jgi:serine/threonine-protein kinase
VLTGRTVRHTSRVAIWFVAGAALALGAGAFAFGRYHEPRLCGAVEESGDAARRLVWIDRSGRTTPLDQPLRAYTYPRLGPDGQTVAVDIRGVAAGVWHSPLAAGACAWTRIGEPGDIAPLWRDARALLLSRRRGRTGLFLALPFADGVHDRERRLPIESMRVLAPTAWHPDGEHLIATSIAASGFDIVAVAMATGEITPLLASPADELNGEVSPDGRWLAYQSRASGQYEVWLRPWRHARGPGRPLTIGGGTRPLWTRNGGELIVVTNDGEVSSFDTSALEWDVDSGEATGVPAPQRRFAADLFLDAVGRTFDVTADGARMLAIVGSRSR